MAEQTKIKYICKSNGIFYSDDDIGICSKLCVGGGCGYLGDCEFKEIEKAEEDK